jgi:hypothetical protein
MAAKHRVSWVAASSTRAKHPFRVLEALAPYQTVWAPSAKEAVAPSRCVSIQYAVAEVASTIDALVETV